MIGKHSVLTLMVGGAICALLWLHSPAEWTAMRIAGGCLIVVGFVLWTVARFQLQLVTHGIYSKIRNPIYVFGSWVWF